MGDLTKDFSRAEVGCPCAACALLPRRPMPTDKALNALQDVRDFYGQPIRINRGVSCAAHNAAVGGASDSGHLPEHAYAFDLACDRSNARYSLLKAILVLGEFSFVEVAAGHIHIDQRPGSPRLIIGEDH